MKRNRKISNPRIANIEEAKAQERKPFNEYKFEVVGAYDVDPTLPAERDAAGNVVGFKLKDGSTAQLVVALEVCKGNKIRYITACTQMEKLGFDNLEYEHLEFYAQGNSNPEA